jgi:2,4-dichlorophenol 6-monooxygenase
MASPKISHLILNTANYEAMKQWYLDVFEAKIGVETSDHSACFLQMDESHHRIGMFNVAKTDESAAMTYPGAQNPGALSRLNHFAFEYPTLAELFDAYQRLAGSSVLPAASLNHGPTMSIYYQDPDRNIVELFYDNQYTDEQIAEFYAGGDGYVLGAIPFDPATLVEELSRGKTVAELTAWSPQRPLNSRER